MLRLTVGDGVHATLGRSRLGRGWTVLYALLALRQGDEVTGEELGQHGPWSEHRPASIGKQVARHLGVLERSGTAGLIATRGRTVAWRWIGHPLCADHARDAIAAWLRDQRASVAPSATEVLALCDLARAQHSVLAARARPPSVRVGRTSLGALILAWHALLEARWARRRGATEAVQDMHKRWDAVPAHMPPAVARATRSRLATVAAFASLPDAEEVREALRAARGDHAWDPAGEAWEMNARGRLAALDGQVDVAAASHARAVACAGFAGDVVTMSGALYNLSTTLRGDRPLLHHAVLVARWEVGQAWRLSQDSAWAPLDLAALCLDAGSTSDAKRWLSTAEAILAEVEDLRQAHRFHQLAEQLARRTGDTASAARHAAIARRLLRIL